jgi:hypothetical protein
VGPGDCALELLGVVALVMGATYHLSALAPHNPTSLGWWGAVPGSTATQCVSPYKPYQLAGIGLGGWVSKLRGCCFHYTAMPYQLAGGGRRHWVYSRNCHSPSGPGFATGWCSALPPQRRHPLLRGRTGLPVCQPANACSDAAKAAANTWHCCGRGSEQPGGQEALDAAMSGSSCGLAWAELGAL